MGGSGKERENEYDDGEGGLQPADLAETALSDAFPVDPTRGPLEVRRIVSPVIVNLRNKSGR